MRRSPIRTLLCCALSLVLLGLPACAPDEGGEGGGAMVATQDVPPGDGSRESLISRGEALELPTEWDPPPGEPIVHHTAGFAKTLCSGTFITGLDWRDAAANVGGFTAPFQHRGAVVDTVVDLEAQTVSLTLGSGITRTAKLYGSQGCITRTRWARTRSTSRPPSSSP